MQFVNNYHVLHARHAYEDDRATGQIRHLKRLWLKTDVLADGEKPERFRLGRTDGYWASKAAPRRAQRLTPDNHRTGVTMAVS